MDTLERTAAPVSRVLVAARVWAPGHKIHTDNKHLRPRCRCDYPTRNNNNLDRLPETGWIGF